MKFQSCSAPGFPLVAYGFGFSFFCAAEGEGLSGVEAGTGGEGVLVVHSRRRLRTCCKACKGPLA
eukprot:1834598-Amphidinium_carterae.1